MRLPKVSQREWMFLGAGALLGYLVVPRIFHHDTIATGGGGTDPFNTVLLDSTGNPCQPHRIVKAQGGNYFCCPFNPGPNGECSP